MNKPELARAPKSMMPIQHDIGMSLDKQRICPDIGSNDLLEQRIRARDIDLLVAPEHSRGKMDKRIAGWTVR